MSLVGLALVAVSLSCGVGAAPEASAPEPAAPEMTAAAEAPTAPEEPAAAPSPEPVVALPTLGMAPTATPAVLIPVTGGGGEEPQPAIPESRRLTFEFPPVMRTGDSARIRLQLEVDDRGNIVPTAIVEGNVVTGEVVEIPNLYETHNVIAEANLDIAGMEVQPGGIISEPLLPGQSVVFYWSVRPEAAGNYEGTAWLHLRLVPKAGGEESRIPISVQFVTIEVKSFMGFMSGGAARGVGALGSVIGSVLGFPFVDDLVKWFWGKIKHK